MIKKLPTGLHGIEEIVISSWQGCQKTFDVENLPLAIHKIFLREEEKKPGQG